MQKIKVGDYIQISRRSPHEDTRGKNGRVVRIIDDYQCKIELENGEATWEHIEHLMKYTDQDAEEQKRSSRGNSTAEDNAEFIRIYTMAYREGLEAGLKIARKLYEEAATR